MDEIRNLPLYKLRWYFERLNRERKEQEKRNQGQQGLDLGKVEGLPQNSVPMQQLKIR